jgi:opacity protein-like surface antigen
MRKTCGFLLLVSACSLNAASMGITDLENPWYGSIGTGLNNARGSEWDTPVESGYNNSNLASRGFYTFEIGKQVQHYVDVSLLYLNHETFNYQMYQQRIATTGKIANNASNPTVNLNNRALLVSGFLHPDHDWYKISTVSLSPFIGGGVGYALNQIDNFYPTGSAPTRKAGITSNSSIAVNSFAWQASAGLSIHPITHLSLDVGYRYYDGGAFDTTNPAFTNTHSSNSLSLTTPWAGHVSTNQLFLDFKYKM